MPALRGHLLYNNYISKFNPFPVMNRPQAIASRIKSNDNFDNVAYVCCDWQEFVFEVEEWGVDHIATVDFDDLTPDEVNQLDEFIASFGCSPENPHPCSKYATPKIISFA
tara:strand:- start:405 stop:734 length:330 start_codon:yes stop_codon:yes gene_type:complete